MNLTRTALTRTAFPALLVGAVLIPAGVAQAAPVASTPTTLAAIQTAGAVATADRIAALNRSIPSITNNECMAESSQTQVLGTLGAALDGMQSLSEQLAAATNATTAAALYRSIFNDWRVYAVAIPQSHYAAAADCLESTAIPALSAAQTALQAALAGPRSDDVTPQIEADMVTLSEQIAIAQDAVAGVTAEALAVTAADFNVNPAVLAPVKTSISTATSAARLAKIAAESVVEALR